MLSPTYVNACKYILVIYMRPRKTNRKRRRNRKTKKIRGGTVIPFSEVGGFFSGISSSLQSALSTFTVLPSGYNPAYTPDVSKQFLSPGSNTIQSVLRTI
jgi:hypothetical protein